MNARRHRRSAISGLSALSLLAGALVLQGHSPASGQTTSSRPTLVLMCKPADRPTTPTIGAEWAQQVWTGNPLNSIDGAIREASYGQVNVAGSRAFGWFTMAGNVADYPDSIPGIRKLALDCTAAARAAGVVTTGYRYLAVYLNTSDVVPGGVSFESSFDGVTDRIGNQANFNTAIVGETGINGSGLMLHEMGHVLGGSHTTATADNLGSAASNGPLWSQAWFNAANGPWVAGTYGATNRAKMGFIGNRKVVFGGGTQQVSLTRLNQPAGNGPLMVEVPVSATKRYVVAARTRIGYDAKESSPGFGLLVTPGVVIERVQPDGQDELIIQVPSTANGDLRSTAGIWLPGQTFTDGALSIRVDRLDDNGADVTITGPAGTAPVVTTALAPVTTVAPATTAPATTAAPVTTAAPAPPTTAAPAAASAVAATDRLADAPTAALPLSLAQDTSAATLETGEKQPCAGIGKTVWIRFTATANGPVTVSTAGSLFDTAVAVYTGAGKAPGDLVPVDCNDDADGSAQSSLTITATAGTTYAVQIGGYAAAGGALRVAIR